MQVTPSFHPFQGKLHEGSIYNRACTNCELYPGSFMEPGRISFMPYLQENIYRDLNQSVNFTVASFTLGTYSDR